MLERGDVLLTWQLLREPVGVQSLPVPARRIGDHRKAYLDYEGPVSGGRGDVRRVDAGLVEFEEPIAPGLSEVERCVIRLRGSRLRGRFTLTRTGDDWVLDAE